MKLTVLFFFLNSKLDDKIKDGHRNIFASNEILNLRTLVKFYIIRIKELTIYTLEHIVFSSFTA